MTTAEKQMDLFDDLSLYEGTDVEYKGARGGLPRDLWESYSAFANTQGGMICLGVTQRGDNLEIHGVENAEKLLSDFWNTINNPSKVCRNLLTNSDVSSVPLEDTSRSVILIDVPRASRQERPVFLGADPFKGTYRRNFEGDYLCRDDEVRRMFADHTDEPADSRILAEFSLADLDVESIKQFRNRWRSRDPEHAWLGEDDRGLLEKLGGWRRDRRSGEEGVTVAGLLMFGKTEAITAPEAIPGFHIDYRERLSDDPNIRWTDRLTSDGTWEANVFQFYQRVILKLSSGPGIKVPFHRNAEGYRQSWTPIHEALQEALVNALIHADHFGQGGVVIDRFIDRFEFSNPGTLLVARDQILRGGVSECRNKCLQKMFQMLGVGDKAGSGVDKIRASWDAQHWRSPSLQEGQRPDRVRLLLPMESLLPEAVMTELRQRFGDKLSQLGKDEVQAVVIAATEKSVTNQRLQEMLPLHRVEITKLLQTLVREGLLSATGVGRGTRYVLGAIENGDSIRRDLDSLPKDPDSLPKGGPHSLPKDPDSRPSLNKSSDSDVEGSSESDLERELLKIASPIRASRRSSPEVIADVIVQLCQRRWLTLRDLSNLLARTPEKLRQRYLTPMVRSGEIALRFPDSPNHPEQAYRARESS